MRGYFTSVEYKLEREVSRDLRIKGAMGRVRTRPSRLVPATQPKILKMVKFRPGAPSLHDLMTLRRHHRCGKCQGLIIVARQDLDPSPEFRCINCGWRPQYQNRVMTELDASQSMRHAMRQLLDNEICKKALGADQ